jgi:chromosome partitioning protein
MKADYNDVIIDVGGRDTTSQRSALTVADLLIVPFKPRSLDIWTLGALKEMIDEIAAVNPLLKCLAVVNQADSRGPDNEAAMEILRECSEIECYGNSIGYRKAFGNAASEGLAVTEMKERDKKACEEMRLLHDYVFVSCFNTANSEVSQ